MQMLQRDATGTLKVPWVINVICLLLSVIETATATATATSALAFLTTTTHHHRCHRTWGTTNQFKQQPSSSSLLLVVPYESSYSYNYDQLQPIFDSSTTTASSASPLRKEGEEANVNESENDFDNHYQGDEEDHFEFPSDEDLALLPKGKKGGHRIIQTLTYNGNTNNENISIQLALTQLDPEKYPSLSKARKACRKGSILIHRGPIHDDGDGNGDGAFSPSSKTSFRARVGDLVHPKDVIGVQLMMGTFRKKRCYPYITYARPKFILPILYEDDYMAVVDKPANIAMYGKRQKRSGGKSGGGGSNNFSRRTVRDALPYCLTPPGKGAKGPLRRPTAVHRLDTPTSGLVVVAKTKGALCFLSQQFAERKVVKEYTAIVNGDIIVDGDGGGGGDEHDDGDDSDKMKSSGNWNIVNYPLGNKYSITLWRKLRCAQSLHAKDGTLTLVEVRPLTGRYHQIRRHFAWVVRKPLVGDHLYAGQLQAPRFRRNGLYLCSNGILIPEHPHYNKSNISSLRNYVSSSSSKDNNDEYKRFDDQHSCLSLEGDRVVVNVKKELPKRFNKLLDGEHAWANRNGHMGST